MKMDFTPQLGLRDMSEDSGCLTGSFNNSTAPFESTPNYQKGCEAAYTPTSSFIASRKRKLLSHHTTTACRLANISETCPSSPQFSSTLNDSLAANLEKCYISPNYYVEREEFESLQPACKVMKVEVKSKKARSAPATPVKQLKNESDNAEQAKTQGVAAAASTYYQALPVVRQSPYKEAINILYPERPKISVRKTLTPQKMGIMGKKRIFSPAKKRLFGSNATVEILKDPIKYFYSEDTFVLSKILSYLSDSDLCRARDVCQLWSRVIDSDYHASRRYSKYVGVRFENKENPSDSPPNSPPSSPESPPVSPERQNFHQYTKIATKLSSDQHLRPCAVCGRASIVEKDIAQCQNLSCGYICCLSCNSFSKTGPQNFYNRCQKAELVVDRPRRDSRNMLSDLSNSPINITSDVPSFLTSSENTSSRYETSGFVSESDSPLAKARRNLCAGFGGRRSSNGVLSDCNRNVSVVYKKKRRSSFVPVVSTQTKENVVEVVEPPSPPKVKNVKPFSKQSKKNLKRLLF